MYVRGFVLGVTGTLGQVAAMLIRDFWLRASDFGGGMRMESEAPSTSPSIGVGIDGRCLLGLEHVALDSVSLNAWAGSDGMEERCLLGSRLGSLKECLGSIGTAWYCDLPG